MFGGDVQIRCKPLRQVRVVYGSLEWPGERDLAYDMLYAESTPLPAEVE